VPTDIQGGSYMAPTAPGTGMEMKADSIAEYTWTGAHVHA
jgi:L-fuconate dehydratase